MIPGFRPGDHVLTFNWIRPKIGDSVVFHSAGQNFLKRVAKVTGQSLVVFGDNRHESVKPQTIHRSQIIGRVILKY